MTAPALATPEPDLPAIVDALNQARERCRARYAAHVYETEVWQCRDMIMAHLEKHPSTILDAAYEVAQRVEKNGGAALAVFVYAAAADMHMEGSS